MVVVVLICWWVGGGGWVPRRSKGMSSPPFSSPLTYSEHSDSHRGRQAGWQVGVVSELCRPACLTMFSIPVPSLPTTPPPPWLYCMHMHEGRRHALQKSRRPLALPCCPTRLPHGLYAAFCTHLPVCVFVPAACCLPIFCVCPIVFCSACTFPSISLLLSFTCTAPLFAHLGKGEGKGERGKEEEEFMVQ